MPREKKTEIIPVNTPESPTEEKKNPRDNKYFDFEPSGGGRPRMILNENGKSMIEVLAGYLCTDEEIAATLGTTVDTLTNQNNKETFSECKEKGQCKGKVSLRRMQFRLAEKSAAMAIFLGKNLLGQTDGLSLQERDAEAMRARASAMKEFAELSSPTKEEIGDLFADEEENDETGQSGV